MNEQIKKEVGRPRTSAFRIIKFPKNTSREMQDFLLELWKPEWTVNPDRAEACESIRVKAKDYRQRKKSGKFHDLRNKRDKKMIL